MYDPVQDLGGHEGSFFLFVSYIFVDAGMDMNGFTIEEKSVVSHLERRLGGWEEDLWI